VQKESQVKQTRRKSRKAHKRHKKEKKKSRPKIWVLRTQEKIGCIKGFQQHQEIFHTTRFKKIHNTGAIISPLGTKKNNRSLERFADTSKRSITKAKTQKYKITIPLH